MPERGYAADRLDPSLANYALTLSEGFAGGGLIEDAANTFTVEFWVKPVTEHEIDVETNTGYGGTANQKFVIFPAHGGAAETGKAGMGVSVGTNGVSVYEHAGGYMPAILVWQSPTPLTAWTHVAVVYSNKLPSLYINGVLVHTAGAASTKDYVYPCYQFPGGYYGTQIGGQMDEVRIWGVARTQAQIAANMNTEVAANSANLLGYWPMNEGTGTMLIDVTGNGRNIDLTAFGAGYSSSGSWTSTGTAAIAAKAAYRYGFNGQEHSTEIGDDSYTAEFWEYDSRAGRRWNTDPVVKHFESPYACLGNNPTLYIDPKGDYSTDVLKQGDGTYKVVDAKNDKDNNIYEVNDKGERMKVVDPKTKKETFKILGQTLNPWDFMHTKDNTGEFFGHADVKIDFNNAKAKGKLPDVLLPISKVKIADVTVNKYGGELLSYLNQYYIDAVKYEGLVEPFGQLALLKSLSANGAALDVKASLGAYTPVKLSATSNIITTVRSLSNIAFGMNVKTTYPGLATQRFFYEQVMKKVGAYNQSQNGGNGYNAGWPFFGEHTYSGTNIYLGFFGKKP